MKYLLAVLIIVTLLAATSSTKSFAIQIPTPTPPDPTQTPSATAIKPREQAAIHAGPGTSYNIVGYLQWQDDIHIIERNRAGTWLHIEIMRQGDALQGWAMTGHLLLNGMRLSEVPVNIEIPDADLANVRDQTLVPLFAAPVIPEISDTMRQVYAHGQTLGNDSRIFTKVGDSLSASEIYLNPISRDDHNFGPHDDLADTVAYYVQSLREPSVASRIGMTTYSVFDPLWVNGTPCQPNESPLACEYRRANPSIAIILFGANGASTVEAFDEQMRRIVEETLQRGIIPVLLTSSVDPETRYWSTTIPFNLALVQIAEDYEIPLINMWLAARDLPRYGLDIDQFHLTHSGYPYFYYAGGQESYYGISLQNLLTLRTLAQIRRALGMN